MTMTLEDVFGAEMAEGIREEQRKTLRKLEEMKSNLLAHPETPGYESKMRFIEQALQGAKSAIIA